MDALKNYKECSQEDFDKAMDFVKKDVPPREISTELLFIIYTKYDHDLFTLSYAPNSSYVADISISTKRIREGALRELQSRGYSREGVKI